MGYYNKPWEIKFCAVCGQSVYIKHRIAYFNPQTGKPVFEYKAVCNKHWFLHTSRFWVIK